MLRAVRTARLEAAELIAVALKDGQDIPDTELRRALANAGYTVKAIQRTETPLAELRERLKQGKP